jgi:hypothetical protein
VPLDSRRGRLWRPVSAFFEATRNDYYDRLNAVSHQSEWAPWLADRSAWLLNTESNSSNGHSFRSRMKDSYVRVVAFRRKVGTGRQTSQPGIWQS